jgi:P2-related tail formation protein
MNERHVIASVLMDSAPARALSALLGGRWGDMDMSPYMVYLVDVCDASVLPYLAEQFDVDGVQGFSVASTEEEQRALIKRSISLHKFIGTPWAVREACRAVGFNVLELREGVGGEWATFSILLEAPDEKDITVEHSRKLKLFVEFYKNERSHLIDLGYFQPVIDDTLFVLPDEQRDAYDDRMETAQFDALVQHPDGSGKLCYLIDNAGKAICEVLVQSTATWGDFTCDTVIGSDAESYLAGGDGGRILTAAGDSIVITLRHRNTGTASATTLTVYKWAYGASLFGYPRTYNLRRAFTGYAAIDTATWSEYTDRQRAARRSAFTGYVQGLEHVNVSAAQENLPTKEDMVACPIV